MTLQSSYYKVFEGFFTLAEKPGEYCLSFRSDTGACMQKRGQNRPSESDNLS